MKSIKHLLFIAALSLPVSGLAMCPGGDCSLYPDDSLEDGSDMERLAMCPGGDCSLYPDDSLEDGSNMERLAMCPGGDCSHYPEDGLEEKALEELA